jgi:hypothetical protein
MRWDRFDLTIKEPEPLASVSVGPLRNLSLLPSDVLTELWIPYVGCEVRGDGFKLTLVGSPLASARMKARTRLKANVIPSYDFVGDVLITVKSPAYFLEARLDYKIEIASMTRASLWGKGGWLWASGGGRLDSSFNTTHSGLLVSILDDRVVRFGRYHLAGGLAVDLSF